jgi:hypothetical protein
MTSVAEKKVKRYEAMIDEIRKFSGEYMSMGQPLMWLKLGEIMGTAIGDAFRLKPEDAESATIDDLQSMVGQAYQVIGVLQFDNKVDRAEVTRALDYFAGGEYDDEFLPWPKS